MKKHIFLLALLTLALSISGIQAQVKVGYINPQAVLEQLPERDAIERKLTELIELKEAEFNTREEEFLSQVRSLQERVQAESISEDELSRQRGLLEQQQEELYELIETQQMEVQRRQQELLQPVLVSIDEAIEEVAVQLGLDYVLNELTSDGEMILLFVSADGKNTLNITNRVVEKLK
ncbi:MAG: OmpH family outer membrane protein [Balneolales bacterium]|nr:OmpH family outer membrane protein [Balneolales bacterium]